MSDQRDTADDRRADDGRKAIDEYRAAHQRKMAAEEDLRKCLQAAGRQRPPPDDVDDAEGHSRHVRLTWAHGVRAD